MSPRIDTAKTRMIVLPKNVNTGFCVNILRPISDGNEVKEHQ